MKFKIQDVLSVATGTLCGDIGGVYEVCNFMTGDNLFTHQLPRAFESVSPVIYSQHPELLKANIASFVAAAASNEITKENILDYQAEWIREFGEEIELAPCADWVYKNPIQEARELMKEVVVVSTSD